MSALTQDFAPEELVTLTYVDTDGVTRAWHGAYRGIYEVTVRDRGPGSRFFRYWHSIDFAATGAGAKWVVIDPADDYVFPALGLPEDPRWSNTGNGRLMFDLSLPGLSVTPVTEEGREFLTENESLPHKRKRLLDQVRALAPAVAEELDLVITELMADAVEAAEDRAAEAAIENSMR